MSAKDLYIQNETVREHDNHSDSFQVKFPNAFMNYPLGAVRVKDKKGPVKLIQRVKIAHSFLQSVSDQFHVIILSLSM